MYKHNLRKSANCNAQISTMCGVTDTDLCVAICRFFSGCVCHLEQLHAQSPFLFPIVFSINYHSSHSFSTITPLPVCHCHGLRHCAILFITQTPYAFTCSLSIPKIFNFNLKFTKLRGRKKLTNASSEVLRVLLVSIEGKRQSFSQLPPVKDRLPIHYLFIDVQKLQIGLKSGCLSRRNSRHCHPTMHAAVCES